MARKKGKKRQNDADKRTGGRGVKKQKTEGAPNAHPNQHTNLARMCVKSLPKDVDDFTSVEKNLDDEMDIMQKKARHFEERMRQTKRQRLQLVHNPPEDNLFVKVKYPQAWGFPEDSKNTVHVFQFGLFWCACSSLDMAKKYRVLLPYIFVRPSVTRPFRCSIDGCSCEFASNIELQYHLELGCQAELPPVKEWNRTGGNGICLPDHLFACFERTYFFKHFLKITYPCAENLIDENYVPTTFDFEGALQAAFSRESQFERHHINSGISNLVSLASTKMASWRKWKRPAEGKDWPCFLGIPFLKAPCIWPDRLQRQLESEFFLYDISSRKSVSQECFSDKWKDLFGQTRLSSTAAGDDNAESDAASAVASAGNADDGSSGDSTMEASDNKVAATSSSNESTDGAAKEAPSNASGNA